MKNTISISVTQDDIDNGTPGFPAICPIALAVKRAAPGPYEIGIGTTTIGMYYLDDARVGYLPEEARAFIREFDNGRTVQPFSFEIDMPSTRRQ